MTRPGPTHAGSAAGSWSSVPARIPALDGIRGLAIGLVMLHHFFQSHAPEPVTLDRLAFGLAGSGWSGVDLFFVLSGFLITGLLSDSKGRPHYFRNFYGRRTLRIFPLYYAVLLVIYVGLPAVPHPLPAAYVADSADDQLWFWTYLSNFRIAERGQFYQTFVPSILWSLAIEEQFYLVWPVVVLLCSARTLVIVCLGLLATAPVIRAVLALWEFEPIVSFVSTVARMDSLALGALLALLARTEAGLDRAHRWGRRLAPPSLGVLVWLALPHATLEWKDPWTSTVGFSLVALLSGALLVTALRGEPDGWVRRVFEAGAMRTLGKYSYALYLLHGPAGTAVKYLYDWDSVPLLMGAALPRTLLFSLVAALVSLFLAWLSWHLLERHFLALQSLFRTPEPGGRPHRTHAPRRAVRTERRRDPQT